MNLALNNLQRFICHKPKQTNKQLLQAEGLGKCNLLDALMA